MASEAVAFRRRSVTVNTSSVNGLGGARTASLYSCAKAGILALTKSAALEYGTQGIRINALVPGAFNTPMLESAIERLTKGNRELKAALDRRFLEMTAAGRIGDPDEAAEAALWLCSEASSYVVGHSLIVDGGLTAAVR